MYLVVAKSKQPPEIMKGGLGQLYCGCAVDAAALDAVCLQTNVRYRLSQSILRVLSDSFKQHNTAIAVCAHGQHRYDVTIKSIADPHLPIHAYNTKLYYHKHKSWSDYCNQAGTNVFSPP